MWCDQPSYGAAVPRQDAKQLIQELADGWADELLKHIVSLLDKESAQSCRLADVDASRHSKDEPTTGKFELKSECFRLSWDHHMTILSLK